MVLVRDRLAFQPDQSQKYRPVLLHATCHVDSKDLEVVAEVRGSHSAGAACTAEAQRLHDNPVAGPEAAPRGRLGNLGKRLLSDDASPGNAVIEMPL